MNVYLNQKINSSLVLLGLKFRIFLIRHLDYSQVTIRVLLWSRCAGPARIFKTWPWGNQKRYQESSRLIESRNGKSAVCVCKSHLSSSFPPPSRFSLSLSLLLLILQHPHEGLRSTELSLLKGTTFLLLHLLHGERDLQ